MVLKDHQHRTGVRQRKQGDIATVSRHDVLDAVTSAKLACNDTRNVTKEVRFAEDRNIYHTNQMTLTQQEMTKQWYSRAELKAMRCNRFKLIEDILKADYQIKDRVNYQTVLSKAFQDCCGAVGDGEEVAFTPQFFQCLVRLLELCPSRHGMELVGVPAIAVRQQAQRAELRRSIKAIQDHSATLGQPRMEESIRITSEAYSRGARLYAGLIALAHAVVSEGI